MTTGQQNYQPTSAPYNADNLKPHDKDLVWLKEFGTNTTQNTGEGFNTGDSGGPPKMSINARLGMLQEIQDGADAETMAGSTFLIPPWSSYPPTVFEPQVAAICLFGHILLADSNMDDPESSSCGLVFGAEDFVGNVDAKNASIVGLTTEATPFGAPASTVLAQFGTGAGAPPTDDQQAPFWGTDLYIRMLLVGDVAEAKQSEGIVWVSQNGLSWTLLDLFDIVADGPLRRIGLATLGAQTTAYLDWLRIYAYRLEGLTAEEAVLVPTLPVTGDRRF